MAEEKLQQTLAQEAAQRRINKLKEEEFMIEGQITEDMIFKNGKLKKGASKAIRERLKLKQEEIELEKEAQKLLLENDDVVEGSLEAVGNLGKKFKGMVENVPLVGGALSKRFELDKLGERMQDALVNTLIKARGQTTLLGSALKIAMGPIGIGLAVFTAIFAIVKKIRKENRDLANTLGIQTSEARKFQLELKGSEMAFNAMGLDGSKLKTTMSDIGKEFGSLENMTVANARNIERFAQNSGVAGSEIVKFNKVMMDLTGSSFDVATNMAKTAADMARSANVSTAKVLGDIAGSAERFAEFSMDGANGLAQAAVEAAKVGASLSGILEAADKLLDFETSISNQFKAQVLSGKQINTERARQLALDGDIAGLTAEIQSIVGQVGDIQTLNVIQRKSVADAIGISVADLLRISRGEQVQQQETVQDKLNVTNQLLAQSLDISQAQLEELGKPTSLEPSLF